VPGPEGLRDLASEPILQRLGHRSRPSCRSCAHILAAMVPVLVALVVVAIACFVYGVAIERRWYRLRRHDLAILPPGGPDGDDRCLTILHLADLHFVRRDAKKARFLASLPRADVTIVTGDFLAEPEAVEAAVEAVGAVRGRDASWFVLGSNDHY